MGDHQIERLTKKVSDIALVVGAGSIGRQKVTRNRIMTGSDERITDSAGILASDQNFHGRHPGVEAQSSSKWRTVASAS